VKYSPAKVVAEGIAWGNVPHWFMGDLVFNSLTDAVLGIIVVVVKGTVV
jgi:hypothetical protein